MTDSCREQVALAAKAVLTTLAATLTPAPKVERNRRDPLDDEELPSLILFEGPEQALNDFSSEDAYRLSLLVQVTLSGKDDEAARAANNLRAALVQAFLADVTLNGTTRNLEISDPGEWIGTSTKSDDTEGFTLQLDVIYATAEGDPFTFAN